MMNKPWCLAGVMALVAMAPAQAQETGAADTAANAPRSVHGLAGFGLSLEGSNIEDWGQTDGGGLNYDYVSGGVGADLHVGVEIMQWLSLRVGHHRFGNQEADIFNGTTYAGEVVVESDGNYFAVDALYPFNDRVLAGITLGSLDWDAERNFRDASGNHSRSTDSGRDGFGGLRGRVLMHDGRAALTAFFYRYSLDTDGTTKDFEYGSMGLGFEVRF